MLFFFLQFLNNSSILRLVFRSQNQQTFIEHLGCSVHCEGCRDDRVLCPSGVISVGSDKFEHKLLCAKCRINAIVNFYCSFGVAEVGSVSFHLRDLFIQ